MERTQTLLTLAFYMVINVTASAQFQRMGISRGTVSIAPASSSEVATYCLDFTRHAPPPSVEYGNVLTGGTSARVAFGGQTMTLQEAIAAKKVCVHGASTTLSELIESLGDGRNVHSPQQRRELQELKAEWAGFSNEEKAIVEREFAPLLARSADYQHLQIENLTRFQMTASFDGAILGVEDEALPAMAPSTIASAGTRKQQSEIQRQQWRTTTIHQQTLLKQVHAYSGPLDGNFASPTFIGAIKKFQNDHSLRPTGVLDGDTEAILRTAAGQPWQSSINAKVGYSRIATVTIRRDPQANARYSVYSSGSAPAYQGNDVRQIAAALRAASADGGTLFLNLEGFSDTNREDFASSIRIQRDLLGDDASVVLIPRAENGDVDREFFRPGIRIEDLSDVELVASGPNKGLFTATVTFVTKVFRSGAAAIKRCTVTLFSSSRDALLSAVAMLRSQPAALSFDEQTSVGEIVAMTRAHVHKAHPDLKTRDLNFLFRDEVGLTQWVLLELGFRQAFPV